MNRRTVMSLCAAAVLGLVGYGVSSQASPSSSSRLLGGACCTSQKACCVEGADTNDDGGIDVSDAVFLLLWRFVGGSPPALPGPDNCGPDPAPETGLGCMDYPQDRC